MNVNANFDSRAECVSNCGSVENHSNALALLKDAFRLEYQAGPYMAAAPLGAGEPSDPGDPDGDLHEAHGAGIVYAIPLADALPDVPGAPARGGVDGAARPEPGPEQRNRIPAESKTDATFDRDAVLRKEWLIKNHCGVEVGMAFRRIGLKPDSKRAFIFTARKKTLGIKATDCSNTVEVCMCTFKYGQQPWFVLCDIANEGTDCVVRLPLQCRDVLNFMVQLHDKMHTLDWDDIVVHEVPLAYVYKSLRRTKLSSPNSTPSFKFTVHCKCHGYAGYKGKGRGGRGVPGKGKGGRGGRRPRKGCKGGPAKGAAEGVDVPQEDQEQDAIIDAEAAAWAASVLIRLEGLDDADNEEDGLAAPAAAAAAADGEGLVAPAAAAAAAAEKNEQEDDAIIAIEEERKRAKTQVDTLRASNQAQVEEAIMASETFEVKKRFDGALVLNPFDDVAIATEAMLQRELELQLDPKSLEAKDMHVKDSILMKFEQGTVMKEWRKGLLQLLEACTFFEARTMPREQRSISLCHIRPAGDDLPLYPAFVYWDDPSTNYGRPLTVFPPRYIQYAMPNRRQHFKDARICLNDVGAIMMKATGRLSLSFLCVVVCVVVSVCGLCEATCLCVHVMCVVVSVCGLCGVHCV